MVDSKPSRQLTSRWSSSVDRFFALTTTLNVDVMPRRQWSDRSEWTCRLLITAAVADSALRIAALVDISADWQARSGGRKRVWAAAVILVNSAGVLLITYSSSGGVGSPDLTPHLESGRSGVAVQRPAANALLTTVVDTWGRSWTPRCPSRSSGLIRRTAVDSCGRGRSPEKRTVVRRRGLWLSSPGSSACLVLRRVARTPVCAASGKKGRQP